MQTLLLLLLMGIAAAADAGDTLYARRIISGLCSEAYAGRGYTGKGDKLAARYIASEFERLGLEKLNGQRFQKFPLSINTIPETEVIYNGQRLIPGTDYLVDPASCSADYSGEVLFVSAADFKVRLQNQGNALPVVLDTLGPASAESRAILNQFRSAPDIPILIRLSNQKLVWSSSTAQNTRAGIVLRESVFRRGEQAFFTIRIRSRFRKSYQSANVLGMVKGTRCPDSSIVITAHYDHLGMMGKKAMFPGANDNASGVSMLLNLAAYYQARPQPYSIVFIAFSGEEAGLLGSRYFTEHPQLSLARIRFLINLDLMANGSEGLMAVNGTLHAAEFKLLKQINLDKGYLPDIKARGKAANSDHYWFSEKGVPAFFFYLMGPYPHYHDVNDRPEMVPLSNYVQSFHLFLDFIGGLQVMR